MLPSQMIKLFTAQLVAALFVASVRSQNDTDCPSTAPSPVIPDCAVQCIIDIETLLICDNLCVCIQKPETLADIETCAARQCTGTDLVLLITSIETCTQSSSSVTVTWS